MLKRSLYTASLPKPKGGFSRAILVQGKKLLFISGQGPFDPDGNLVGKGGDMAGQARQTFENIKSLLEAAGANFSNVVKMTIFITDMSKADEFRKVRSEYIVPEFPAASLVGIATLGDPDILLEVEAIAVLD